ncbi:enoyl-CoA hydratase/isomerase family protein [Oceanicoccus sp. KOV_DT_Chl]|uniref:enoyl-CoA hydratase/isomerase family protein n=1 Tax=Oceanicoccus sp. KOV_DT_Chl TaxID=1904639 RepID=UPI000C7CD862|nr:enoyl-CoA hydratase/isomerase family protein [Oceanicoccus sp. KOV_DT_Chl]
MTQVVQQKINNDILEIKLNRPEVMNAISPQMLDELIDAFQQAQLDRSVRVIIVTGEGKGFCAGADLTTQSGPGSIQGTEGMSQLGFVYKYQERIAEAALAIHECDKPVIAAINGAAVGGGLAFALACDLRVAAKGAKFGSVFIKTGLSSCDIGVSYFLPKLINPTKAMELMLTGRIFKAEEADQLGLLNALVEPEQLREKAIEYASAIAENSEYGVWMTKKGFWNNINAPSLRHAMEIENRTQALGYFTGCMEEMMAAFSEGRTPKWRPL